MRNYVETEKCLFGGDFIFSAANVDNTKKPGVIFRFFTRPTQYQNVDPEAGCNVKVGLKPQFHERGRSRVKRDATSESVVGRRAELLNGFIKEHHWQAGLQLPFRVALIEPPAARQCKPVSPAKRFRHGGLWALKKLGVQVHVAQRSL